MKRLSMIIWQHTALTRTSITAQPTGTISSGTAHRSCSVRTCCLLSDKYFTSGHKDTRIIKVVRKLNDLSQATITCADEVGAGWKIVGRQLTAFATL